MNKDIAKELSEFVAEVAKRFSRQDREMNHNKETFSVDEIIPTSDHTAVVYFTKDTGKIGLAFFYYIPRGMSKGWKYFFPTDSHINGMQSILYYKSEVERRNYKHNF